MREQDTLMDEATERDLYNDEPDGADQDCGEPKPISPMAQLAQRLAGLPEVLGRDENGRERW